MSPWRVWHRLRAAYLCARQGHPWTWVLIRWDAQAGVYVGYAPGHDVYSQGGSPEHARRATISAVRLYRRTLDEKALAEPTG